MEKDCQARNLSKEDAIDRSRQRKLMKDVLMSRMSEWMNVSSGTGPPRLSRTRAVKELYVCVCELMPSLPSHEGYKAEST